MPFVTEAVWEMMPTSIMGHGLLMTETWPIK
jgi:hypothetical protein